MFIAYEVSVQLIESLRSIIPAIETSDRDLADQLRRAASSVALNLAEGQRSQKGNKQKHYAIAHGSANEVKAALDVARAWGWLERDERDERDERERDPRHILDRLLALLWRLTHPR